MKHKNFNDTAKSLNKYKKYYPLASLMFLVAIIIIACKARNNSNTKNYVGIDVVDQDSLASKLAFEKVYEVLQHPRCLNCHPAGDIPLQGDDSHLHGMMPRRGPDGKGLYAMKCTNCHQDTNAPGLHAPPGNPQWHLPPADMKMVFQGKTANELAKQLVDKSRNGNKTIQELIEHAEDTLVKAGWHPGEGLSLPPISHEEFKQAWIAWLENGAYAPDESN